jgi:uncharacterized membrane protein
MMATRQQRQKLSTWGVPMIYAAITIFLGMLLPRFEHHYLPQFVSTMSSSSAIAVCSAISSGMIALTGIVFSLTFLMVQFSASAYSPRLVLWVARDPVITHALGVFTSTFLYALMVMAWVDRQSSGKVPLISGMLVFVLLLASVAMFIALIDRVGLLQVNRMLIFTGDQGRKAIDELPVPQEPVASSLKETNFRESRLVQTLTHVGRPQVIQAIRVAPLVKMARDTESVIELVPTVGDTVLEMMPLLRVYGARHRLDEQQLRNGIDIGDEREFEQDPKYAIRLVVDIAIKALSPAINDPTTAVQALDQIEDLLLRLGKKNLNSGNYCDDTGCLRLIVPSPEWDDLLRLGLDEIRFCGATSVQVMRRMKALIVNLTAVLPAERHPDLEHWEQRLQHTVARAFSDIEEKQDASVPDRQGLGIGEEPPGTETGSG